MAWNVWDVVRCGMWAVTRRGSGSGVMRDVTSGGM